jgi:c-di-GMP-binding flagellar brake protein YcgR
MEFEIGRKLYVAQDKEEASYVTSVQDVSDQHILAGIPYYRSHPMILGVGDGVLVTYVSGEAVYRFSSVCRGRKVDRVPLYLLDRPETEKVERIQRRQMVRVPVVMDVFAAEKTDEFDPIRDKLSDGQHYCADAGRASAQYHRWFSADLSGGGIRLVCDHPLVPGTWLVLEFTLAGYGSSRKITTLGRAKRLMELEDDDLNRFAVGIEFEGLAKADEDAIVAHLFRKMVEDRRLR